MFSHFNIYMRKFCAGSSFAPAASACYTHSQQLPVLAGAGSATLFERPRVAYSVLAVVLFASTSRFGQNADHLLRQTQKAHNELDDFDNQVHGQFTSLLCEGRCQRTGLTPLTVSDYTIKSCQIRTYVRIVFACHFASQLKSSRCHSNG